MQSTSGQSPDTQRPVSPNFSRIIQMTEHFSVDIKHFHEILDSTQIPLDERQKLEQICDHQEFLLQEIIRNAEELQDENHALWAGNLIDELTGLMRKTHMIPLVAQDLSERRHEDSPHNGCLVIMDINDMKGLNDDFGHFGADEILAQLTKLAKTHLRDGDRAFRFGGDEFVLFLRGANAHEGAKLIARRILSHLSRRPIMAVRQEDQELKNPPEVEVRISFCLGAASLPIDMPETEEEIKEVISLTLRKADALLYTAKNHSKSQQTTIAYKKDNGNTTVEFEEEIMSDRV